MANYKYKIRIGINTAPNYVILGLNGCLNIFGWGITGAQRVMDLAEDNQISCSAAFAELIVYDVEKEKIEGEYLIKHSYKIRLFNFYREGEFGNSATPSPERQVYKRGANK